MENDLDQGEKETGIRLGKRLSDAGVTSSSPMLLFYDAVNRSHGDVRLLMATWLVEGLEQGLGFSPDVNGAGIQGDHACSATRQYTGGGMDKHAVISMAFSDDIRMDSVIVHGCRPASPYYTVTKADGSAILEINGKPALQFTLLWHLKTIHFSCCSGSTMVNVGENTVKIITPAGFALILIKSGAPLSCLSRI